MPPGALPARGTRLYSPPNALPAPSTNHNQPRMPFSTPTPRKVAAGPARRGFPRAGGWRVGAGKRSSKASPPLERSPPARRRRVRALTGGTEERSRSEGTTVSDRGRCRRPRRRAGRETGTDVDQSPELRHSGQPERHTLEITRPVPP